MGECALIRRYLSIPEYGLETELQAPGFPIPLRMGAACIDRKILQRHLECAVQSTRTFGGEHRKDITQDDRILDTHEIRKTPSVEG